MKDHLPDIREGLEDLLEEPDLMESSGHKTLELTLLWLRNVCVAISTALFLLSFFLHEWHGLLRGIAYFAGAGAYLSEIGILTDGFHRTVPHRELFMAYCFGPLYVLMGLAYLLE